jgi:hypothetical protein
MIVSMGTLFPWAARGFRETGFIRFEWAAGTPAADVAGSRRRAGMA